MPNPTVQQIQAILVRRGHALGSTGPNRDGVDGDAGQKTFDAMLAELRKSEPAPTPISSSPPQPAQTFNEEAFFASLRSNVFTKGFNQSQVDGIKAKLKVYRDAGWSLGFASYGFATSYWETAKTMQPIEEYGKGRGRRYGVPGKHGQVAYGRGDVQLTWDYNYEKADQKLGLGGALTRDYSKALDPAISAKIMVGGMSEGWFTGKKLSDYLPTQGGGTREQFKQSRRIINGTDHWEEIADIALKFQQALQAGGW